MSRFVLEALGIIIVAVVLGTAFHLLRTDAEGRIPFVRDYPNAFRARSVADEPPSADPGPGAVSRAPDRGGPSADQGPSGDVDGPPIPPPSADVSPATTAPPPSTPAESKSAFDDPDGIIREIELADAIEEWENGTTFLDARRTKQYQEGHIPRARPMSVWEGDFDEKFSLFLNEAELEAPYVVYCMSKNCEDSHMLAERMKGAGFTTIMVFRGGFPDWKAAGRPVESGSGAEE